MWQSWLSSFLQNWPQIISYLTFGLFGMILVSVLFAFFIPMSMRKTRWLCNLGVSAALVLAVNGGVLYFWHHYFR